MKCEAGGCDRSIVPGNPKTAGGRSDWTVYRIPAGWAVSWVVNEVAATHTRFVILCPIHCSPATEVTP